MIFCFQIEGAANEWTNPYAYRADAAHNPGRKLFWTAPYLASWLNKVVVTGVMPVDVGGQLFAIVAADVNSRLLLPYGLCGTR